MRLRQPGACSLAFQNVMEMVIRAIICWDKDKGEGREGAFGIPIAYGRADEEQNRCTLHSHMQLWIASFNELRRLLFSQDIEVREEAKKELIAYIDKVMCASYGWEVSESHRCCDSSKSTLQGRPVQVLRDCRHHEHCAEIEGKVVQCSECLKIFSSKDIVNASLCRWRGWSLESGELPVKMLMSERLDLFCQRHPYDYVCGRIQTRGHDLGNISIDDNLFWSDEAVREILLHRRYDEHDFNHRPSCFKKGVECRAALPKLANPETQIVFATEESVPWPQLNNGRGGVEVMCPFEVVLERRPGDEFVNVFNRTVANLVGSNTNIQIGDFAHVYYSTLYTSKTTQKDDTTRLHFWQ